MLEKFEACLIEESEWQNMYLLPKKLSPILFVGKVDTAISQHFLTIPWINIEHLNITVKNKLRSGIKFAFMKWFLEGHRGF